MAASAVLEAPDDSLTAAETTAPKTQAAQRTPSGKIGTSLESHHSADVAALDQSEEDNVDHTGSQFVLTDKYWIKPAWTLIVMALLAYTATIFLYRFAFITFRIGPKLGDEPGWDIVDMVVDGLFWLDLLLNFFLSYKDAKGIEVDSLKLIAIRYMRFNFWVNLMACIPSRAYTPLLNWAASQTEEEAHTNASKALRLYRLQRVSRLARLMRVTRLAKFRQLLARSAFWQWFQHLRGVRIVNFIFGLLWVVHLLACGWYVCAALHPNVEDTWVYRREIDDHTPAQQWTCAMYWVLMVFTTVGFGDIVAITEAEMIYCALTMVIGAVVHSIVISEVIGIVTSANDVSVFLAKQMHLVEAFSAHTHLDPDLARTMKSQIKWRATHSAISPTFDKTAMRDLITGKYMPRWLISRIPQSLFGGRLLKSSFLKGMNLPPRLPTLLAMHVLSLEFVAGDIIFQMHDFPFNLFLVLSGTFACVGRPGPEGGLDALPPDAFEGAPPAPPKMTEASSGLNDKAELYPYRLFSAGSYFGDLELFQAHARLSTCRCERRGSTLTLHKKDFSELQDMFPEFAIACKFSALRREGLRRRGLAQLTCGQSVKHFAAKQIQRYVRGKCSPSSGSSKSTADSSSALTQIILKSQHKNANTALLKNQVDSLEKGFNDFRNEMLSFRDELRTLLQQKKKI